MAGPRPTLRGAVQGEHVRLAQRALAAAGSEVEPDGVYGPRTAQAVRSFQEARRIAADGVVGKQTWDALLPGEPFVEPLHGASGGDDVRELQQRLAEAGFEPGEADGVYGPAPAAAVERLQSAHGLSPTGVADPEAWDALDATVAGSVVYPVVYVLHHEASRGEAAALAQVIADRGGPVFMTLHVDRKDALDPDELANAQLIVWGLDAGFTSSDEKLLRPLLDRAANGELRVVTVALIDNAYSPPLLRDVESVPAEDFGTFLDGIFPRVPRSTLPGYAADTTGGRDLLGIQDRVDFLASVLAARQLETPLAIGLFGDWGSGKSFFMRRLQERIAALTEES